jgi:hypothetical protein
VNTAAVLAGTTEEQRVEREDPGEGLERQHGRVAPAQGRQPAFAPEQERDQDQRGQREAQAGHEEDGKRGDDHLPHDDRAADDGHGRAQLEIRPKRWGQ